jgi:hypothetical protein
MNQGYYVRIFGIHACILTSDEQKAKSIIADHAADFINSSGRCDLDFIKSMIDRWVYIDGKLYASEEIARK